MKNIVQCLVRSLPLSLLLISLGYVIAYLVLSNPQQLDFILFTLGAIPVVIFLPSVFSQSKSGAIHTPKVIFRKVETLEKKQNQKEEAIFPALSNVIAGVLTWLFSLAVY